MEIDVKSNSQSECRSIRRKGSPFDIEPHEFQLWLESSGSTTRRVDIPCHDSTHQSFPTISAVWEETDFQDTLVSPATTRPSQPKALSVFGYCSPLFTQAGRTEKTTESSHQASEISSMPEPNQRLFRLMSSQQAWYDARLSAEEVAAKLLQAIDHHQGQWLTSPNSNPPVQA